MNNNLDESPLNKIEQKLFLLKYVVNIAVLFSLILSVFLFLVGGYEVFHAITHFLKTKNEFELVLLSLRSADMFLFAMVMLIFAFGSYSLFVSNLDRYSGAEEGHETYLADNVVPKWVRVKNFGELKAIFIKVITLVLSLEFMELVIRSADRFLTGDLYLLLVIPLGIVLIAYSLRLTETK